ncbi:MarR family winged helix-turn-helix transcriptional regulator [Streptomyces spectabilis]|uniref:MarR family transcriptional regulator n=1 Tax=Streptomyces spectabilis TaxID=68270 RepID=A0A516RK42_STRST|nr:MarR family transcriptional regulator [Streptomyces spectabilis]QDQ16004.1 MarR family transcriptional regulator [Streptomyces spectabilis]
MAQTPTARCTPAHLAAQATRLAAAMDAVTDTEAAQRGLTRADFEVLAALRGAGADRGYRLRTGELAGRCHLSSGGTSNIIRRMAESGYVVREADLHDGRGSWAQLTEEGRRVVDAVRRAADAVYEQLLSPLPAGAADALSGLISLVAAALEQAPEAGQFTAVGGAAAAGAPGRGRRIVRAPRPAPKR